ncbi:MAG TPA: hypothetical protein DCE55_09655 [Planctomycetaceae bacterium]|nr:hypothetical protein [Planctomycetaceae bacterium]
MIVQHQRLACKRASATSEHDSCQPAVLTSYLSVRLSRQTRKTACGLTARGQTDTLSARDEVAPGLIQSSSRRSGLVPPGRPASGPTSVGSRLAITPARPRAMIAKLVPQSREDLPTEFVLEKLPMTLGRCESATIYLNDRWVSRLHCEIDLIDGSLIVRDLGSKHGTILNGTHTKQAQLMPGDRLSVGMVTFEVVLTGSAGNANDDSQELRQRHPR